MGELGRKYSKNNLIDTGLYDTIIIIIIIICKSTFFVFWTVHFQY